MIFLLKVLALLFLVLLNGFFVASEFAIVKIRETRLVELANRGSLRAKIGLTLIRRLDAYLSATQLGITMTSLGLGWLGEPLVSEQLEPVLHSAGVTNETLVTSVSVAAGFAIITFLHIVFGELAPKSLAIQRTEGTTLWIAIPLRMFYWSFFPAIWLLNGSANGLLKLIGISPAAEEELAHSEAELRMLLSESARGGHISEQEKIISRRALRLADVKARQIMVPRNEVVYFSIRDPLEANLAKARRNPFARYPVCDGDLDSILGVVHVRDVLWVLRDEGKVDLRSISREIIVSPEDENLEVILGKFRDSHIHMAVITDEVGSVSGIITLENVLEQLVGQIQDEFDHESPWIRPLGDDVHEVSGRTPLTVLRERLGMRFEDDDVATLSGYVTDSLGRFPKAGDELTLGSFKIEVNKVESLKIKTALIKKIT